MAKEKIREWSPTQDVNATPRVSSQEEGKFSSQRTQSQERPKEPEKLLVGKRVIVHFMDGTSLTGTLALMHQYTFVLEYEGKSLLIYKHGVKLVEEAS